MQIEQPKKNLIPLNKISGGETFFLDGTLFLKLDREYSCSNPGLGLKNSVNLSNGQLIYIGSNTIVELAKAKIFITG